MPHLIEKLRGQLVVSCQPVIGGPLDRPEFVRGFALAAESSGAAALRIAGLDNLRAVRPATRLPIIGIVKRKMPASQVFITPEVDDVLALAEAGADIIAFDATLRPRPLPVKDLVAAIRSAGKVVMADIATIADATAARDAGADLLGTTLSGYTGGPVPELPDVGLVSQCAGLGVPVFAEGRYRTVGQVQAAVAAGAMAVVVGSAITRPEHITAWFVEAVHSAFHEAAEQMDTAPKVRGR